MGVLRPSSRFRKLGEGTIGLRISDGKVPEPGVCREEAGWMAGLAEVDFLSKPAAAMVAVTVADAMVASRRRFREQRTGKEAKEWTGNDDAPGLGWLSDQRRRVEEGEGGRMRGGRQGVR